MLSPAASHSANGRLEKIFNSFKAISSVEVVKANSSSTSYLQREPQETDLQ